MIIFTRMLRFMIILSMCLLPIAKCFTSNFRIFWNAPTDNCHKFGMNFAVVRNKFGIIQNTHDTINGDKVVILYRPGLYPYLRQQKDGPETVINGGVPQKVDLAEHLVAFEKDLREVVDPNFSGYGMISYEDWRPLFHQSRESYQKLSIELTTDTMSDQEREDSAVQQFEDSAKKFMLESIKLAQNITPKARWSYHDYHNCFNFVFQEDEASCPPGDQKDNDKLAWLWQAQDFINPLMWVGASWAEPRAKHRIAMTTNEAVRIIKTHNPKAKVIPYLTLRPEDGEYIKKDIAFLIFKQLIDHGADGTFIWERPNDFNTKEDCQKYLTYMSDIFGLAISDALGYVKIQRKKHPHLVDNDTIDDFLDLDDCHAARSLCKPFRNSSLPECQSLHILTLFVFVCMLRNL